MQATACWARHFALGSRPASPGPFTSVLQAGCGAGAGQSLHCDSKERGGARISGGTGGGLAVPKSWQHTRAVSPTPLGNLKLETQQSGRKIVNIALRLGNFIFIIFFK